LVIPATRRAGNRYAQIVLQPRRRLTRTHENVAARSRAGDDFIVAERSEGGRRNVTSAHLPDDWRASSGGTRFVCSSTDRRRRGRRDQLLHRPKAETHKRFHLLPILRAANTLRVRLADCERRKDPFLWEVSVTFSMSAMPGAWAWPPCEHRFPLTEKEMGL